MRHPYARQMDICMSLRIPVLGNDTRPEMH